ncbi:hypothetical protein DH2020_029994 [Rehmannia glutinosa]|uniref:Uncharacterized protein n=1 Tax=Rehmannia glutinosa TaxID=99300 RepID=A0ABR0VNN8_REHGL
MGQQGTWDTTISNNGNNMNIEICGENHVHGNIEHGLQSDASFDFATGDDGLISNNFNLNNFDYDHSGTGQVSPSTFQHSATTAAIATEDPGFWSSWVANFAREF